MTYLPPLTIEQEIKLEINGLKKQLEKKPSRLLYLRIIELTKELIMCAECR